LTLKKKSNFNATAVRMRNSQILLSSGAVTHAKINQLHRNANWNCNSLLQNNIPSFNAIAARMAKKSTEN
jgi:hypothetical protein